MARWERKLKLSVRKPTSRQPSVSKAWLDEQELAGGVQWLRCRLAEYQV